MHEAYMKRCMELAEKARGYTAPNPMVGAVLVHNDVIIGEGWHKQYGQAHAEVNCIESVAPENKALIPESTMYVCLEPCAHYGKTPPCAVRLAKERIKEVIIANTDPFEKVGGRGIEILKEAGIKTETGVLAKEGRWLNRRFFCFHEKQRPYIILKWAQTKEGYFAPTDKSRLQLSNNHSQQLVHKWRTEESAIMVGYKTALNDNPKLTARLWEGKQPLRIVQDEQLQLPDTLNLFDRKVETWVVNSMKQEEQNNIEFVQLKFDEHLLAQILKRLHAAQKLSLILEGGAALLNRFIQAGLWDEARIFTADASLAEGIAAPLLTDAIPAFETNISGDELQIYTNRNSGFDYVNGMGL